MSPAKLTLSPHRIEAAVFDLDGVLTDTARIHAGAWKDTFDAFLKHRAEREGQAFEPFDDEAEYLAYVDGRRRRDGVRTFLASRRIAVPEGSPDDPPGSETVEGIARAKDDLVQERLRRSAVPMPGAKALLSSLRDCGVRVAVASSSANCGPVLAATSLAQFADARVDGIDARELEFPGKPDPAMFLEALQRLGVGRIGPQSSRMRSRASRRAAAPTSPWSSGSATGSTVRLCWLRALTWSWGTCRRFGRVGP